MKQPLHQRKGQATETLSVSRGSPSSTSTSSAGSSTAVGWRRPQYLHHREGPRQPSDPLPGSCRASGAGKDCFLKLRDYRTQRLGVLFIQNTHNISCLPEFKMVHVAQKKLQYNFEESWKVCLRHTGAERPWPLELCQSVDWPQYSPMG